MSGFAIPFTFKNEERASALAFLRRHSVKRAICCTKEDAQSSHMILVLRDFMNGGYMYVPYQSVEQCSNNNIEPATFAQAKEWIINNQKEDKIYEQINHLQR